MGFSKIEVVIDSLDITTISKERRKVLAPLITFIQTKVDNESEIRLNFICTHNSRRSHFSQVWAQAIASYFNLDNVVCYSGGTEATALYPMVIETLQNSGFKIEVISDGNNPIYSIKYANNQHPILGFSKIYDSNFNPTSEFAAIMTCSHADGNCPMISGAEKRIPITFEDPKISDGTAQQKEIYAERSLQIATELKYVFSEIKHK